MKLYPSVILVLSFFISNLVFAQQQLDYTISEPYKTIDAYSRTYFSNTNTGKLFSIKRGRHYLHMQSFDAINMTEIRREKIKIKDFTNDFQIEAISWVNNRLYLIYAAYDKREKLTSVYAREIDFDRCSFKGPSKKIIESHGSLGYHYYSFLFSKDQTKLLVWLRLTPKEVQKGTSHGKIEMFVFGDEMKKIAQGVIKMPYADQKMHSMDFHIDEKGKVYILAKARKNLNRGADKNSSHLELLAIDVKSKKIKISEIDVNQYSIKSAWLFEGEDGNIICSGLCSKEKDSWMVGDNPNGLFLFKLDDDDQLRDKYFYKIPIEIIKQYTTAENDEEAEKNKAKFESLVLQKLIIQDDNSILIIGEEYFVLSDTYINSRGGLSFEYSYHYCNILVTKIGADGKLAWMKKIPKRQIGKKRYGGSSYKYMNIGRQHYFLYLDNAKNMKLPVDETPAIHNDGLGGVLVASKLEDETGKVNKIPIFNTRNVKGYKTHHFKPDKILPVSKNEFVIEFYKKRKQDIMVKVKVD